MPQVKKYTATREMKLDCGHTVKAGDGIQVVKVFTCTQEGSWPLKILMACFYVISQKRSDGTSVKPDKPNTGKRPQMVE